ncbi:MAG TPA: fatty acid desaturase [Steroidobacteraceae bacterium]|nr:fatty acid desaturase [Steroidobacteraceae bacterium]
MSITTADRTARTAQRPAIEMPTLLLLAFVYAGWLTTTFHYSRLSLAISIPLTALLITLHSSLQHEMTHGHPTRWRSLNRLLAMVPLSLWMPYDRYLQTHHAHHIDARLTDPVDDPESYYWAPDHWARLSPITRAIFRIEQTLAGRIIVGAFWRIWLFWCGELKALVHGVPSVRRMWLEHLIWLVPVVLWLKVVCGIPLWLYFVCMAVPANGIQLIRSFAEHRAHPQVPARIAIVEDSWILGPLFLFNNLHSLHHESPGIPWYQCPARYRAARERLIARNGGLVYSTYFEVARRFLFRAHDVLPHPMGGIPRRAG